MIRFLRTRCVCVCVCVCRCSVVSNSVNRTIHPNPSSILECVCLLSCFSHVQLCSPVDCSPPGSSVHGILRARIQEWIARSFPKGSCPPRDRTQVSCAAGRFFATEPLENSPPDCVARQTGHHHHARLQHSYATMDMEGGHLCALREIEGFHWPTPTATQTVMLQALNSS